jgi:hypothetical protein
MLAFCVMTVCLVLGGVAGCLIFAEAPRGIWHQLKRVPVRMRRPVWQRVWGPTESLAFREPFLPPPRVATRMGPLPTPPASWATSGGQAPRETGARGRS